LKENDKSIKQLALDLLYLISNESNVHGIIKELMNFLITVTDSDFLLELTLKICAIVEKHAPTRRWYIDTVINVLTLAGNYVSEQSTSSLIHFISATPQLQSYAVHKLYFSLLENQNQVGLVKAAFFVIGEFGAQLVKGAAVTQENTPV